EDSAEASHEAHHVWRGDGAVEVQEAFVLDALDEVFGADDVGSCLFRLDGSVAAGEHGDTNGLSGSVRQRDRGTDHLVGVTRIHTKTGRTLDGLVELGERDLTEQFAGFVETVTLLTVDFL